MNKIQLIQNIGNEICEGCGPDRDCGLELDDCDRISTALDRLDEFMAFGEEQPKTIKRKGG